MESIIQINLYNLRVMRSVCIRRWYANNYREILSEANEWLKTPNKFDHMYVSKRKCVPFKKNKNIKACMYRKSWKETYERRIESSVFIFINRGRDINKVAWKNEKENEIQTPIRSSVT